MNFDDTQLLPCGHVGTPAGVCQYSGCGTEMCTSCDTRCESCLRLLCPEHQIQLNGGHTLCPDHVTGHVAQKLVKRLAGRLR
jgi:hypothetical protein